MIPGGYCAFCFVCVTFGRLLVGKCSFGWFNGVVYLTSSGQALTNAFVEVYIIASFVFLFFSVGKTLFWMVRSFTLIAFFLVVGIGTVLAQDSVVDLLENIMKRSAKGRTSYEQERLLLGQPSEFNAALFSIQDYYISKNLRVKMQAFYLTSQIGLVAADRSVRQKAVNQLLMGLEQEDGGLTGVLFKDLMTFSEDDFSGASKVRLEQLARAGTAHYPLLIKLTGHIALKNIQPFYKNRLESGSVKNRSIAWAMHLALARMGDDWEENYCIERVRKLGLSDEVVLYLFPDLVYINNPKVYDYLLETILKESKNCRAASPDSDEKVICAFRVIELVAGHIKDFPVKLNRFGEIETHDYEATLFTVREWIKGAFELRQQGNLVY